MINLRIMKWDNCYTFILKYKNIFEKYFHLESDEFLKTQKLIDYIDNTSLINDDIIVFIDINSTDFITNTKLLKNGVLIEKKYLNNLHFAIFTNNLIYDVSFIKGENYIRIRELTDVKLNEYKSIIKIIRI